MGIVPDNINNKIVIPYEKLSKYVMVYLRFKNYYLYQGGYVFGCVHFVVCFHNYFITNEHILMKFLCLQGLTKRKKGLNIGDLNHALDKKILNV